MAGPLDRYNSEIIAETCSKCGAAFPVRCGGGASRPRPPHKERMEAAGWTWNREKQVLERIQDGEGVDGPSAEGSRAHSR